MMKSLLCAASATVCLAASTNVCVLYTTDKFQFALGDLQDTGNITQLLSLPTWTEVPNGIDGGETPNVLYVEASVNTSKDAQLATIKTGAKSNVTYTTLQAVPGYPGTPTICSMNVDESRQQMVGLLERADQIGYFLIADLFPKNGTVSKVWVDLSSAWPTWDYMKYGVSTFDDSTGTFFFVMSQSNTQKIAGASLSAGKIISYYNISTVHDTLAIKWSKSLGALVAFVDARATGSSLAYIMWNTQTSSWDTLFSYKPTIGSQELGQMEIESTGTIAAASFQDETGAFGVSWVDLQAKKEIKRVTIPDKLELLADLAWCDAGAMRA